MSYHIVCRVGPDDEYLPKLSAGDTVHVVSLDRPGDPKAARIRNSVSDVLEKAHLTPPPVARDLLNLSMAVYASDLGIPRGSAFDRWTRDLSLHVPVADPDRWKGPSQTLIAALRFLSGDHWEVHFRKHAKNMPSSKAQAAMPADPPSAISLFSGGLDSFIGAIERLEHAEMLGLVGHHAAGMTKTSQDHAHAVIDKAYPSKTLLLPFYVQAPSGIPGRDKKTTRARSFLFLGLGTTAAAACGTVPLLVPENGLISINAPLLDPRLGRLEPRYLWSSDDSPAEFCTGFCTTIAGWSRCSVAAAHSSNALSWLRVGDKPLASKR